MEMILLLGLAAVVLLGLVFWLTRRPASASSTRPRAVEALDTLMAWQPSPTRLLTGPEREAHAVLRRALPEYLVFAQVPLARFLKVPTRHSYTEWLRRVGQVCADFVICEANTLAVAVVEVRPPEGRDSPRARKRQARMERVVRAAGLPLHVWHEGQIPDVEQARASILQSLGLLTTEEGAAHVSTRGAEHPAGARRPMATPETTEPPSSTWFDDLDSAPTPLSPPHSARRP